MQNNDQEILIWRSEYNINNFKIDSEHQKLFSIAREAINVSKLKNGIYILEYFINNRSYSKKNRCSKISNHAIYYLI